MKNRNTADIVVVLYIFLLITIGLTISTPSSYAPGAAQPDSHLVAAASQFRTPVHEK
jgi:hypothetical protein